MGRGMEQGGCVEDRKGVVSATAALQIPFLSTRKVHLAGSIYPGPFGLSPPFGLPPPAGPSRSIRAVDVYPWEREQMEETLGVAPCGKQHMLLCHGCTCGRNLIRIGHLVNITLRLLSLLLPTVAWLASLLASHKLGSKEARILLHHYYFSCCSWQHGGEHVPACCPVPEHHERVAVAFMCFAKHQGHCTIREGLRGFWSRAPQKLELLLENFVTCTCMLYERLTH